MLVCVRGRLTARMVPNAGLINIQLAELWERRKCCAPARRNGALPCECWRRAVVAGSPSAPLLTEEQLYALLGLPYVGPTLRNA